MGRTHPHTFPLISLRDDPSKTRGCRMPAKKKERNIKHKRIFYIENISFHEKNFVEIETGLPDDCKEERKKYQTQPYNLCEKQTYRKSFKMTFLIAY